MAAMRLLKDDDAGRAGLLVGRAGTATASATRRRPDLPAGARWALDLVDAPRPAAARRRPRLLADVAVVDDLATARRLVERPARSRAVTADGDVLGRRPRGRRLATTPSLLEVQAAVDEARRTPGRGRPPHRAGCASRCSPRWRTRRVASPARSRPPSTGCTSPMPGWPPSPSSSASSARRPGPPAARPSGSTGPSRPPRRRSTPTGAALAELEERLAAAQRDRAGRRCEVEPDTDLRDELERSRPPPHGRPRSRRGSPCAPARSGSGHSPGAPSSSARAAAAGAGGPGPGRGPPGRAGPGRPPSPRRSRWPPRRRSAHLEHSLAARRGGPRAGRARTRRAATPSCGTLRDPAARAGRRARAS